MCDTKTITKTAFYLFIVLQNYLLFNYYFLSESIRTNQQMGYVIFFIVLLISIFLIFILPKKISKIEYFSILRRSKILKYVFISAKFAILLATLYIGVRTLNIALFTCIWST